MKGNLKMLALIAGAMVAMPIGTGNRTTPMEDLPTDEERRRAEKINLEKYYKSNGLKEFKIEGEIIWARNLKNAQRKFRNKNK